MLKFRLLTGSILMMLAGICFAGLHLAPPEEQPFVSLATVLSSVLGAIVQFGTAVAFVSSIPAHRLHRWSMVAAGIPVVLIAVPLANEIPPMLQSSITARGALTLLVGALTVSSFAIDFWQLQKSSR